MEKKDEVVSSLTWTTFNLAAADWRQKAKQDRSLRADWKQELKLKLKLKLMGVEEEEMMLKLLSAESLLKFL